MRLHMFKKGDICTTTISKYNAHTEPLIKVPVMYNPQLYKLYYKIQQEPVPHYFNTVIPTLSHQYNIRQDTLPQYRTMHTFTDQNYLNAMIALNNILIICTVCQTLNP